MANQRRYAGWVAGLFILLAVWLVAAVWIVPSLIRDAYDQESVGFMNRIMAGRGAHPVDFYLGAWSSTVWRVTGGLALAGTTAWLTVRTIPRLPATERLVTLAARYGLAALFALSALWAVSSVWFPLGWDHGIMASVGDVIVRGGMPYADGWDMKGPLPYYVFAFTQWVLGPQVWGIRVVDLGLVVGASTALGRLVGRVSIPRAAPWAGLALFLWYASRGYFFTAQPDGWVAMGMTLCFAPLMGRVQSSTVRNIFFCGFVVGLATLVKPLFAAFLFVPALHLATTRSTDRHRTLFSSLVLVGAFITPVALTIGWFAARGALGDLFSVHIQYAAGSYARVGSLQLGSRIDGTLAFLWRGEIAVLLPIVFLGAYAAWRVNKSTALLLSSWLGVALFTVIFQGKFFEYHWIPTYPPIVALASFGVCALLAPSAEPRSGSLVGNASRILAILALIVGLARVAYGPGLAVIRFTPFAVGRVDADEYYGQFGLRGSPYSPGDERQAARFIRSHTDESDGLVIFGTNAGIHYLSRRTGPTRFVFSLPLMHGRGTTRNAYREEFLGDLRRQPPTYVVVGMTIDGGPKEAALADFPEFAALLDEAYTLQMRIGHLDVYRRIR